MSAPIERPPLRPELAPVRAGEDLDWDSLAQHLRAALPELDGPMTVQQFPNGSANLTYLVAFGDRRLVVRRPPFGAIAPGAHDMRREHRCLSQLWKGYDRAPRSLLFVDDHAVVGSDLLVVEYRPGVVIRGVLPPDLEDAPDAGRRLGLAVVDALGDLHRVDPAAVGLERLGRPDGFVVRQLAAWQQRWALVRGDVKSPAMDEVARRLAASTPESPDVAVLHNDYKVDNCQFAPGEPDRVISVFDWDQATLGDPLVDLGILLNYWPDPSDEPGAGPLLNPGMEHLGLPTRAEVVERYAAGRGIDVDPGAVRWYEAFAAWKTVVVLQQLHLRWLRGESTDPRMAERGRSIPGQVRRAVALVGG